MIRKTHRGGALILSIMSLMLVFVMGSALMALSIHAMRRSRFDVLRPKALALADAGVEKAMLYLRTVAPDGTTDGTWRTNGHTETVANHGSFTVRVQSGAGINAGKIIITSSGRTTDGYQQTSAVPGQVIFAATTPNGGGSTSLSSVRTIRVSVYLDREEISIWNNAVFGGVGQSGRSINGNVRIAGGVHLLGDGESFTDVDKDGKWDSGESYTDSDGSGSYTTGEPYSDTDGDGFRDAPEPFVDVNGNGTCDPALTVTDLGSELGGTAGVHNNYNLMPSDLRSLIPNPHQVDWKGESVESLKAKLRVKHGQVSLNGTATVGEPQAGGSPYYKETMDGTYVSDGFTGNANYGSVFSDNGSKQGYNLSNMVSFPTLLDPTIKSGVSYPTYMDYLKAVGLNVTGPLTFKPGVPYGPISDGRGNYFAVDASGNIIIRGIIYVNGDVMFDRNGGNSTMRYTGRGTIVTSGNLNVEADVLAAASYPLVNTMGFIARRNMSLGVTSQLKLSGAYYAQQKIISSKQNELLGTFVTSYFEMKNVPHMYQVPRLVDNLPPGMPGSQRIWVKSIRVDSWREVTSAPTI